jgi:hypothetical protein
MDGEVHRQEGHIIEYPENYEDMKKKYLEREEEKLNVVMARRKAESPQALEGIATKAISTRMLRAASEHKALKDRTILREAKSEDIQDLKKKLNEEITAIGQRILKELPKEVPSLENKVIGLRELRQLKGRISQTPPRQE